MYSSFLQKVSVAQPQKTQELALWRTWKSGGKKPEHLRPLLKAYRPMLATRAGVFKRQHLVSPAAIDAEAKKLFVRALDTYDPKSAQLGSWVWTNLNKLSRYVVQRQNVARIPEERVYKIQAFRTAKTSLRDDLGREPLPKEIARETGFRLKDVKLLGREIRQDLLASKFVAEPPGVRPRKEEAVLSLIGPELSPSEAKILGFVQGGRTSTSEIAREMAISPSAVSQFKRSLARKIEKRMRRL